MKTVPALTPCQAKTKIIEYFSKPGATYPNQNGTWITHTYASNKGFKVTIQPITVAQAQEGLDQEAQYHSGY